MRTPTSLTPLALVATAALAGACTSGDDTAARPPVADASDRVSALACPDGPGCASGAGRLTVGVAKRAITPAVETWMDLDGNGLRNAEEPFEDLDGDGVWDPVWVAGFGLGRAATGVHDDNWARVLTFTQGDVKVAVVALDLIGYFHDRVVAVRRALEGAGLDLDHVIVATTHQHEGQDTMGIWGKGAGSSGIDPAYMERIIAEVVAAAKEASAAEVPVRLEVAQVAVPELIADSREPEVIDPTATTVRFLDDAGALRSTLVLWGNHPEALGGDNTLVTSDYPHYLRERLEREAPGSTAVFLAGTLGGLMNPLGVKGCPDETGAATCRNGDFAKAEWMGEALASRVLAGFEGEGVLRDAAPSLAFRREPLFMPIGNARFLAAFSAGILDRAAYDAAGERVRKARVQQLTFDELLTSGLQVQSEVNTLRIGPLEILCIPGELYPELWLTTPDGGSFVEQPMNADFPDAAPEPSLRALMPDAPMKAVLNQANDALGYIIPKAQFDADAPHAYRDNGQYGEENSVGPESAPTIVEAVKRLYGR